MMNDFHVVTGEVDKAIDIIRGVARWCEETGKDMWKPYELTKENLLAGLTPQNFCIGMIGNRIVSAMILQWHDTLFWPEIGEYESGFIHKLCVDRKYSGQGISGRMVDYAKAECKRKGIRYLRLDTGWNRDKLRNHYEKLGFSLVGKKTIRGKDFALYEVVAG